MLFHSAALTLATGLLASLQPAVALPQGDITTSTANVNRLPNYPLVGFSAWYECGAGRRYSWQELRDKCTKFCTYNRDANDERKVYAYEWHDSSNYSVVMHLEVVSMARGPANEMVIEMSDLAFHVYGSHQENRECHRSPDFGGPQ